MYHFSPLYTYTPHAVAECRVRPANQATLNQTCELGESQFPLRFVERSLHAFLGNSISPTEKVNRRSVPTSSDSRNLRKAPIFHPLNEEASRDGRLFVFRVERSRYPILEMSARVLATCS